jgi:GntR family transcriptional regulator
LKWKVPSVNTDAPAFTAGVFLCFFYTIVPSNFQNHHKKNKKWKVYLLIWKSFVYNITVLSIIIQLIQVRRADMFDLDVRSGKPIYEQLVEKFKELIIKEVLKPDEQLPSVRMLAQQLTINPNTIQKAYRELERQGYIYSIQGKGNFVNALTNVEIGEKLKKIKEDLEKIISEALYLGLTIEDLQSILSEIEKKVKGGG